MEGTTVSQRRCATCRPAGRDAVRCTWATRAQSAFVFVPQGRTEVLARCTRELPACYLIQLVFIVYQVRLCPSHSPCGAAGTAHQRLQPYRRHSSLSLTVIPFNDDLLDLSLVLSRGPQLSPFNTALSSLTYVPYRARCCSRLDVAGHARDPERIRPASDRASERNNLCRSSRGGLLQVQMQLQV